MDKNMYKSIVDKYTPKENRLKNSIIAFLVGGFLGGGAEVLLRVYVYFLEVPRKEAGIFVVLTLILIASLLTAFGIFDTLVSKARAGLIIPITGFAHSIVASAMEYKNEGLIYGIGSNIFKLSGSVILYGVVSVYFFSLIRLLIGG